MTLALALRYWKYGVMALLLAGWFVDHMLTTNKLLRCREAGAQLVAASQRQNEAVTRLQSASAHLIAKAQEARQNADAANAPLRDDVARIRAEKPSLGCATPTSIMRSGI